MLKIYKCPSCGAALEYRGDKEMMVCPKCTNSLSVQNLLLLESQGQSVIQGNEFRDPAGTGSAKIICPACSAPLTEDEFSSAMICPFCSNPVEMESRLTGSYEPKYILPFKYTKADAKAEFRKWAKKGRLTPSAFKTDATLDQSKGVYIPSWLYTYYLEASLKLTGEKSKKVKAGNTETTTTEKYTISMRTAGTYERVPKNADENLPDGVLEVLEPYDYKALTEFAIPYLSGYYAEKYHVPASEYADKVKDALKADMIEASKDKVEGFENVKVVSDEVRFSGEETEYVLLPVWKLDFKYGHKKYPLFMNGQTGKIQGTLPISKGKVAILFGSIFAAILIILIILWRVLS